MCFRAVLMRFQVFTLWGTFLRAQHFKRGSIRSSNGAGITERRLELNSAPKCAQLDTKCALAHFSKARRTFGIKFRTLGGKFKMCSF
ncbi:hypothetical protein LINPERHAP1_LOCUS25681 [Linum perenne]